jgi:hypothetical protein
MVSLNFGAILQLKAQNEKNVALNGHKKGSLLII